MSERTDQEYLLNEQYKDASNLNARIQLHQRFSTNGEDWYRWLFDHFSIPEDAHILELGSGSALLWKQNLDRLPAGWQIALSDLSAGMLDEASKNVSDATAFTFEVVDAQAIPFDAEIFDTVIANHMLYHVPDQTRALAEIRRVLKPDGFALVTCPDLGAVGKLLVTHGLGYKAYDAPAGPITVQDMIFGHGRSIAGGTVFMAHNCGFTADELGAVGLEAGFAEALVGPGASFDLWALLLMPGADKAALREVFDGTAASFLLTPDAAAVAAA